jgi:CopG family transcriptional regulator, nickel-responsive regulator
MERITMSVDGSLAKELDALIAKRGYASRSEAMRDLLRREAEAMIGRLAAEAR